MTGQESKESFADAPQSVAELRAKKEEDASKWTPRDALIHVLRQMDSGEIKPELLVVVWEEDEVCRIVLSSPSRSHTIAALETTKIDLIVGD